MKKTKSVLREELAELYELAKDLARTRKEIIESLEAERYAYLDYLATNEAGSGNRIVQDIPVKTFLLDLTGRLYG
jgi:hypothetical protein